MANDDNFTFPRIPEKNWWILRDQFAKSIPNEVSIGYLKSLLQLNSEKSASNLLPPLKQLGLIDEDNKPTDLANDWRNDTKYTDACETMLQIYPQELRDLFDSPDVEKTMLENWFQYTGKLGQTASRQAASLYRLLLEATPKESTDVVKSKSSSKSSKKKKDTKHTKTDSDVPPPSQAVKTDPEAIVQVPKMSSNDVQDWFSLHVDLQIHISPDANAEQIDNIFASMAKHIIAMKQNKEDNNEGN